MSSTFEDLNSKVSDLIAVAKSTLKINRNDVESFLNATISYLDKFESVKGSLESQLSADQPADLKEVLSEPLKNLQKLHGEIVSRAESSKDLVADVISDVHKRSHALKKYVDGYPDRISITRKKEG